MWQRAQTLYLALIVIILSLTLIFPFSTFPMGESNIELNLFGLAKNTKEVFGVGIIDMDVYNDDPEARPEILIIRHESKVSELRYCHDT